jgi:putative Mg2+ transporter-C (MgtC) family protein
MDSIGENLPSGYEIGFFIRAERESRSKPAEIGTHRLVIGGSIIFRYLSAAVDSNSTSRIGAQLVTGNRFLGRGIILKREIDKKITNLTTAAAIWFAAPIGMAIGLNFTQLSCSSLVN